MSGAFNNVATNGGIQADKDYPFERMKGDGRIDENKLAFSDKGHAYLHKGSKSLQQQLNKADMSTRLSLKDAK